MGVKCLTCLLVLFICVTSAPTIQTLNSIKDLKKIGIGHAVPQHSLVLLHWFANYIEIDNNDAIPLTFDPNRGDYGSHHYANYEGLLDKLPWGRIRYKYYTIGNLNPNNNQDSAMVLPSYVTRDLWTLMVPEERNRDRIVFRVREEHIMGIMGLQTLQTIDQVYITQHYEAEQEQGTGYDQTHTYRITTNLLRELREFNVEDEPKNSLEELRDQFGSNVENAQLSYLTNTWAKFACLGLLLLLVTEDRYYSNKADERKRPMDSDQMSQEEEANIPERRHLVVNIPENRENHWAVNIPGNRGNHWAVNIPENRKNHREGNIPKNRENHREGNIPERRLFFQARRQIKLKVRVASNGKAIIYWKNIPAHYLKSRVMVVLFKSNEDQEITRSYKCVGDKASGSFNTSIPLNPGLQVRLHKARRWCFWTTVGEEICRGREYQNPTAEIPVPIRGFGASLQLFVKDCKACARLKVRKTFTDWLTVFQDSWVGFYTSSTQATHEYEFWKWQWATQFTRNNDLESSLYYVYEYHSYMPIGPGVQARFILGDGQDAIASTPVW